MKRPASSRGNASGGYVLVAVLGVMLVLTGLIAAASLVLRSALHAAVIGDVVLGLEALTQEGLEVTAYQLFVRKMPTALVDGRQVRFAGGTIRPRIVDEGGKVDLNGSDPAVLTAVFTAVGLDAGRTATLVARIVAERGPKLGEIAPKVPAAGDLSNGPPITDAVTRSPPNPGPGAQQQRRRGWQTIDDLRDGIGLSRDEFRAVESLLTVYNPGGKVDVFTASRTVLLAIPGLGSQAIDVIMTQRSKVTKETIASLTPLLQGVSAFVKLVPGPAYRVKIEAESRAGQRKTVETIIAASKGPNDPYLLLDWRDVAR